MEIVDRPVEVLTSRTQPRWLADWPDELIRPIELPSTKPNEWVERSTHFDETQLAVIDAPGGQ